jgi:hypothetical protein
MRSIEGYAANRLHDVARNLRKYLATSIALAHHPIAQKFSKLRNLMGTESSLFASPARCPLV